jgi:flagellar biosynthesis protein FlhB
MAEEQDLDRNEAATPFKLEKAREQGQTPRSADMVGSFVFLAAMLYLASQGMKLGVSLLQLGQATLLQAADVSTAGLWHLARSLLVAATAELLPFLIALPITAVIAAVFSVKPLHMDFARINPATGFKRLFSMRTLFDGGRACLKLLVLSAAALLALQALLPQFQAIAALPPTVFLQAASDDLASLGLKMGLALVLVSAVDLLFTRREFGKNMRMSRRELQDEFKNREGDPRVRARVRELRRELLKRSLALKNTRTADVVLTNPTHYAVALRYVHGEMEAPRVVAKGAGQLAAAMREIAARHDVVVVQNPPLARALFKQGGIDEYIPASFHAEVARIIVWVLAMRAQRARAAGAAA